MKIAVTSTANELSADVDPRFGRCAWYIVFDTETGEWEAVDNSSSQQAAHGAGIQAAQTVARHGVETVLTGNCGPKAYATLQAAGIQVVEGVSGSVADAVERFKGEELHPRTEDEPREHCGGKTTH